MPQTLLEARQHTLLVADLGIDNPVGVKPGLGNRRRKQVAASHTPQDLSRGACHDAGRKQCRCCAVDGTIAATGHFVESAERQAAAGDALIDCIDTER